jgi:tRNA pseudouridine38-40 synthase
MNHCIQQLFGEHDFSTFEKKGSDNKTSVCTLENAYWEQTETGLVFTIKANRFLRNMVRRITAALLLVGVGKMNEQDIVNAVLNKESLEVKLAVPAKGLFLWKIEYEFNND